MSGPFQEQEGFKEISDINVVPLADVSLVLLIILLLLSPMMTQSMLHVKTAGKPVENPSEPLLEEPAPPKAPELVLVAALGPNGIAVGDRLFTGPGEFIAYLKGELARRQDKKVFLSPHPDVPHGLVVHTLQMIQSCGASSVALVQTVEP